MPQVLQKEVPRANESLGFAIGIFESSTFATPRGAPGHAFVVDLTNLLVCSKTLQIQETLLLGRQELVRPVRDSFSAG